MATKYNWDVITGLYNVGYTTSDISAIYGTSTGTISKGIKSKTTVEARSQGKASMALDPTQFPKKLNDLLREANILDIVRSYYDNVIVLQKASYIYRHQTNKTQEQLAKDLGIGKTQIYNIKKKVEPILAPYVQSLNQEGLKKLPVKKQNEMLASNLRSRAIKMRTRFGASARINNHLN